MTSQRLRRNRRIFTVVPAAALAAVLGFTAVGYACVETWGSVNISATTLEPGDAFQVSGTALPSLGGAYRLRMATNGPECHHIGLFLGGNVLTDVASAEQPHPGHTHGDTPTVTRIIPSNLTSGVRYLCWNQSPQDNNSVPRSITIV